MRRRIRPRRALESDPSAIDASDTSAHLIRVALVVVFALSYRIHAGAEATSGEQAAAVWGLMALALVYTLAAVAFGRRLILRRPLALVIDLSVVTSANAVFADVMGVGWLVALYYPVVLLAAAWHRLPGAISVALAASACHGIFGLHLRPSLQALWEGGAPAMLLLGFAAYYIMLAREREREALYRLQHDMALARRLQDEMLPSRMPSVPGLDIGYCFRPARSVGGDIYDVIRTGPRKLLVCIGDMAGKSVYGLFHLSLLHSHMHAAVSRGLSPAEIAETVNRDVFEALQPHSFAAVFFAELDLAAGLLTFVNCGHLPPLLMRAKEPGPLELSSGGIVIGAQREPNYTAQEIPLRPGDVLVCYTDGITEAKSRRKEEFGLERLTAACRAVQERSAQDIADALMAATDQFSRPAGADDRTVLVVRVEGLEHAQ